MKLELEPQDIELIAQRVVELLRPLLSGNSQHAADVIFGVEGLAQYLNVSKQWIYERTHLKEIPHLKIDGQLRFRKKDIDKWLNSYNVPAIDKPESILKAIK
jgi:excisionase family DNA binding protein